MSSAQSQLQWVANETHAAWLMMLITPVDCAPISTSHSNKVTVHNSMFAAAE